MEGVRCKDVDGMSKNKDKVLLIVLVLYQILHAFALKFVIFANQTITSCVNNKRCFA